MVLLHRPAFLGVAWVKSGVAILQFKKNGGSITIGVLLFLYTYAMSLLYVLVT